MRLTLPSTQNFSTLFDVNPCALTAYETLVHPGVTLIESKLRETKGLKKNVCIGISLQHFQKLWNSKVIPVPASSSGNPIKFHVQMSFGQSTQKKNIFLIHYFIGHRE